MLMSLVSAPDRNDQRYYQAIGEQITLPPQGIAQPKKLPIKFLVATILTASITKRIPFINRVKAAAFVAFTVLTAMTYLHMTRHRRRLDYTLPPEPLLGKWTGNHDVIISRNVEETFQWKKRLIQSAKHSIELSPNYAGGQPWREILSLIQTQMVRENGLRVHLIVSEDLLVHEDIVMLMMLTDSYPGRFHYLITNACYSYEPNVSYHMQENHVKMLVVDNKYFVVGGSGMHKRFINQLPAAPTEEETLAAKVLPRCSRDTDVIGTGPLVPVMRGQFFQLYNIWEHRMTGSIAPSRFFTSEGSQTQCAQFDAHDSKIQDVRMKFLVSGPEHSLDNPITRETARRIQKAASRVLLATYMLNPDIKIRNALLDRRQQHVQVEGIFNGDGPGTVLTHSLFTWTNRSNYDLVDTAYEMQGGNVLYHKKVMLVDDLYAMVGSFNLGRKSAYCDHECAVFFKDGRVCKLIDEMLEEDKRQSLCRQDIERIRKSAWTAFKGHIATHLLGNYFG